MWPRYATSPASRCFCTSPAQVSGLRHQVSGSDTTGLGTVTSDDNRRKARPRRGTVCPMRLSFKTAPQHTTWAALRDLWVEADDIDVFDAGWTFDHFYPLLGDTDGPCLEGWTVTTALAAITTRLRLGLMVVGNTYRHPAVLANMAAALDQVSNGRLELGIGAGWHQAEHDAYGIALPPLQERVDRPRR